MNRMASLAAGFAATACLVATAFADDFGVAPPDYQDIATDYIESRLENPRGARIEFVGEPYRVYADIEAYPRLSAWAIDVRVKARLPGASGFGSYLSYTVVFVDGDAVALDQDDVKLTRI